MTEGEPLDTGRLERIRKSSPTFDNLLNADMVNPLWPKRIDMHMECNLDPYLEDFAQSLAGRLAEECIGHGIFETAWEDDVIPLMFVLCVAGYEIGNEPDVEFVTPVVYEFLFNQGMINDSASRENACLGIETAMINGVCYREDPNARSLQEILGAMVEDWDFIYPDWDEETTDLTAFENHIGTIDFDNPVKDDADSKGGASNPKDLERTDDMFVDLIDAIDFDNVITNDNGDRGMSGGKLFAECFGNGDTQEMEVYPNYEKPDEGEPVDPKKYSAFTDFVDTLDFDGLEDE